jgi:signal transduction histidine kinase
MTAREERTSRDLAQALYVAALALGRARDAEEVVRVAIAETQGASGVEAVALHLLDPQRNVLLLREYAGTAPAFRDQMQVLPLADAQVAGRAIREGRAATIAVDSHPTPALQVLYAKQGFRHLTVVPVAGREAILGVMHLASREATPLTDDEVALAQAIGGLVGVALENAVLRETMAAQQDRLRALASGILQVREEEARRIAHTLHDEASQLLASVHIALDDLANRIPEHTATLRGVHELLDSVETQLRRLSRELRPSILDDLGLSPALEWLARGMAERTGISITVNAAVERLPATVETALYRIAQETLTNAVRHARASRVQIEVGRSEDSVWLSVRDDGQGFDVNPTLARRGDRGLGLIGIRERVDALGGKLIIESERGTGTSLWVTLPIGAGQ